MSWVGKSATDCLRWDSWCVSERWAAHSKCFVFLRPVVCSLHECFMCLSPFWDKPAVLFLCPNGDQDLWAAADCCYAQSRQNPLTYSYCLFCVSRSGRSSVGLPGRGVRSTSQHRALQQPPLRQEPQQSRLPACGQLSAKCFGPTSGPARGLPNELRPLAGEGSLLQTYFLGRTATVRLDHRQHSCRLFLFFLFCFLNSFSQVFRWSTTSALTDQQNSSLNRTVCYTFCIDWRWRMDFILSFQHGGVLSGVLLNAFGVWTFAFWEILHCYDFCVVFSQKKIILLYLGSLRRLLPRSQFFNEIADNDLSAKTPFADLNSAPSLHYRYFLCVPLTCYCRFATHQEALHDHTFTFKFK